MPFRQANLTVFVPKATFEAGHVCSIADCSVADCIGLHCSIAACIGMANQVQRRQGVAKQLKGQDTPPEVVRCPTVIDSAFVSSAVWHADAPGISFFVQAYQNAELVRGREHTAHASGIAISSTAKLCS